MAAQDRLLGCSTADGCLFPSKPDTSSQRAKDGSCLMLMCSAAVKEVSWTVLDGRMLSSTMLRQSRRLYAGEHQPFWRLMAESWAAPQALLLDGAAPEKGSVNRRYAAMRGIL